jgi:hypothetical protein
LHLCKGLINIIKYVIFQVLKAATNRPDGWMQ